MSLLEKFSDHLRSHYEELERDRHPYLTLESKGFSQQWVLKQGVIGCRPVKAQTAVLMEKSPPPIPGEPAKPTAAVAAAAAQSEPQAAASVATSSAPASASSPSAAASSSKSAAANSKAATPKPPEEDCPQPPPFDMLDIPEGMQAMGFELAARYAKRWFNGKKHVIPERSTEIYDKAYVDTDSCKMDWVLRFGTVRERYAHLLANGLTANVKENIYNTSAHGELIKASMRFMSKNKFYNGTLRTLVCCDNDIQRLHQQFQFQLVGVSMSDVLGVKDAITHVLNGKTATVMNDLAASLANFNLYAAVATAEISNALYNRYDKAHWRECTRTYVKITQIYVYAKDSYSFNDDPKSAASQYLGHWNKRGVIIAIDAFVADLASKKAKGSLTSFAYESGNEPKQQSEYLPPVAKQLDKPVDIGSNLKAKDVFYPIRNRDFNRWRELKERGGDFLIFSDLKLVTLPRPIEFDLDEVCWELKR